MEVELQYEENKKMINYLIEGKSVLEKENKILKATVLRQALEITKIKEEK